MFIPSDAEILRPSGLSSDRAAQVPHSNWIFAFYYDGVWAFDRIPRLMNELIIRIN
jgi:hypothetical protein